MNRPRRKELEKKIAELEAAAGDLGKENQQAYTDAVKRFANAAQTNDPKAVETVAAEFGQQADELAETDPENPLIGKLRELQAEADKLAKKLADEQARRKELEKKIAELEAAAGDLGKENQQAYTDAVKRFANAAQTNDPKAVETVAAEFGQQADELAETDPENPLIGKLRELQAEADKLAKKLADEQARRKELEKKIAELEAAAGDLGKENQQAYTDAVKRFANAAQTNDPKAVETVAAEFGQQADELAETDPENPLIGKLRELQAEADKLAKKLADEQARRKELEKKIAELEAAAGDLGKENQQAYTDAVKRFANAAQTNDPKAVETVAAEFGQQADELAETDPENPLIGKLRELQAEADKLAKKLADEQARRKELEKKIAELEAAAGDLGKENQQAYTDAVKRFANAAQTNDPKAVETVAAEFGQQADELAETDPENPLIGKLRELQAEADKLAKKLADEQARRKELEKKIAELEAAAGDLGKENQQAYTDAVKRFANAAQTNDPKAVETVAAEFGQQADELAETDPENPLIGKLRELQAEADKLAKKLADEQARRKELEKKIAELEAAAGDLGKENQQAYTDAVKRFANAAQTNDPKAVETVAAEFGQQADELAETDPENPLIGKLRELQAEADKLAKKLADEQARRKELEKKIAELEAAAGDLGKENQQAYTDAVKRFANAAQTNDPKAVETVAAEFGQQADELAETDPENPLIGKLRELQAEADKLAKKLADEQARRKELEKKIAELEAAAGDLGKENQQAYTDAVKRFANAAQTNDPKAVETVAAEFGQQADELAETDPENPLIGKLRELQAEADKLAKKLADEQARRKELEKKIAELEAAAGDLGKENQQAYTDAVKRFANAAQTNDPKAVETVAAEFGQQADELAETDPENPLIGKLRELQAEADKLAKKLADEQARRKELENKNSQLADDLEARSSELQKALEEAGVSKGVIDQIKAIEKMIADALPNISAADNLARFSKEEEQALSFALRKFDEAGKQLAQIKENLQGEVPQYDSSIKGHLEDFEDICRKNETMIQRFVRFAGEVGRERSELESRIRDLENENKSLKEARPSAFGKGSAGGKKKVTIEGRGAPGDTVTPLNLDYTEDDSYEWSFDEFNERLISLTDKRAEEKLLQEIKEVCNELGTPEFNGLAAIINSQNDVIGTAWDTAKSAMERADAYKVPTDLEETPPDNLQQQRKKRDALTTFKEELDKSHETIKSVYDKAVNDTDRSERATPVRLKKLEGLVHKYIANKSAIYHSNQKRLEHTSSNIYKQAHKSDTAEVLHGQKQAPKEIDEIVADVISSDRLGSTKDSKTIASENKKRIADIISGRGAANSSTIDSIITRRFKNEKLDVEQIWSEFRTDVLKHHADPQSTLDITDQDPHIRGYQCAKSVQHMLFALDAHMKEHAKSDAKPDSLRDLRRRYETFVERLAPDNWGETTSGKKRSGHISPNAIKCIEAYRKVFLQNVEKHFETLPGSEIAKSVSHKITEELDKHECTKNSVGTVDRLFRENPKLAKRWVEKSLALRKSKNYEEDSQHAVQSLLHEFDLPLQIPVGAFLQATMKDTSRANSKLLPHIKTYYFNEKSTSARVSKAEKYTKAIAELHKKEAAIIEKRDHKVFFRGMTQDKTNGKPIEHHYKRVLEKFTPEKRDIATFETKEKNSSSGVDKGSFTRGFIKEAFGGEALKGEKFTSTGEVYVNLDASNGFEDQGISFKTSADGHPVEVLGVRGCNWKVSPEILLNNPNLEVPFLEGDKQSFIPITNVDKVTGNESEGILLFDSKGSQKKCYLYTLTDDGNWRCRPIKPKDPESASREKYEGYLRLAVASGQEPKKMNTALQQAYKAYCSMHKVGKTEEQFKRDAGKDIGSVAASFNSWMEKGSPTRNSAACKSALSNFEVKPSGEVDATDLAEVENISLIENQEHIKGSINPAVAKLRDKLFKNEGSFRNSPRENGDKNFPSASLAASFELCDKTYIEVLKKDLTDKGLGLINYMQDRRRDFTNDYLKQLRVFDECVVDISGKTNVMGNVQGVDRLISQFNAQESSLSNESQRLYTRLKSIMKKSGMNLKDVDEARKLWIQGKGPAGLNPQNMAEYNNCMWELGQVNWTANRLRGHINDLTKHRAKLVALESLRHDDPDKFKKEASKLNVSLAGITVNLQEMNEGIDEVGSAKMDSTGRALGSFLEDENKQLRKNQLERVPDVMRKQAGAIKSGKGHHDFMMLGTGGGKTMSGKAMVVNMLNSLAQKEPVDQLKHTVMLVAPNSNAKQLRHDYGLSEQRNDRRLQDMGIIEDLVKQAGSARSPWWNNSTALDKIYKRLLGIDENTPDGDIEKALKSRRSACLLSFSQMQILLHTIDKAKALEGGQLSKDCREKLNKIRDLFSNACMLGDECVSAVLPYLESDQEEILKDVKEATASIGGDKITKDDLASTAMEVMSNAFLFTGLSATKATPAIAALFAQKDSHEATAKALREDPLTTRLRAFDRIGGAKVVRVKDNDEAAAAKAVVKHLAPDQGVTVLDTNKLKPKEGAARFHANCARTWNDELQGAKKEHWKGLKDEKGEPFNFEFKMGYVNGDGEPMLFDDNNPRYKAAGSSYGNVLQSAHSKSLKAAGVPKQNNFLSVDQGVGTDPLQGKDTAFVITGILSAIEHGRSDLVEQWLGRGTRASDEPFHRQRILLTISPGDIAKIEKVIDKDKSPAGKAVAGAYDQYKESLKAIENKEKQLDALKVDHQDWVAIISDLEKNSLDFSGDSRTSILNKLHHSKENFKAHCLRRLKGDSRDAKVIEDASKVSEAIADKVYAEEVYQLDSKQLIMSELARRENTTHTRAAEDNGFKGDLVGFEKNLYAEEERWAHFDAKEVVKEHEGDLDKLLTSHFTTVKEGDGFKQLEEKHLETTYELAKKLLTADYLASLPKNLSSEWKAKELNSYIQDRIGKKDQNAIISEFRNQDLYKARVTSAPARLPEYLKTVRNTILHDIERLMASYDAENNAIANHKADKGNKRSVKMHVIKHMEDALDRVARRERNPDYKGELGNKIGESEFRDRLESELDIAVSNANQSFDTTSTRMKARHAKALNGAKTSVKTYGEFVLKQLVTIKTNLAHKQGGNIDISSDPHYKRLEGLCERAKNNRLNDSELVRFRTMVQDYAGQLFANIKFNQLKVHDSGAGYGGPVSTSLYRLITGDEKADPENVQKWSHNGYMFEGFSYGSSAKLTHTESSTSNSPLVFPSSFDKKLKELEDVNKQKQTVDSSDQELKAQLVHHASSIKEDIIHRYQVECQQKLHSDIDSKLRLVGNQKNIKQPIPAKA